jgi:hydrogenase maturation protease
VNRPSERSPGGDTAGRVQAAPAAPEADAPARRILVIGYGNPGRGDDGLGPALAARLAALRLAGVTAVSEYQLSIEHAELVARHDVVVFADAARDAAAGEPFYLRPVTPSPDASCFSHQVSPQAVLQLAADCFDARPAGWLLGIRPLDLDSFAEGLTPTAMGNLTSAVHALLAMIENGRIA